LHGLLAGRPRRGLLTHPPAQRPNHFCTTPHAEPLLSRSALRSTRWSLMSALRPHLRTLTAVAAGLAAATLLSACAGSPEAAPDSTPAADTADDTDDTAEAFPVTIESSLGEAVIDAKPERVVTLGWGAADIALS